jgi:hypothetical protein
MPKNTKKKAPSPSFFHYSPCLLFAQVIFIKKVVIARTAIRAGMDVSVFNLDSRIAVDRTDEMRGGLLP